MRVLLIFLLFLFVSALIVISNGNLHLKDKYEAKKFADIYYSWLYHFGENMFKTTAYVVRFDWLPNSNTAIVSNSSRQG